MSPEQLARQVKISNMTIRRLLKKPPRLSIPEKYHAQLDTLVRLDPRNTSSAHEIDWVDLTGEKEFKRLLTQLEKSGKQFSDLPQLKMKTRHKLRDSHMSRVLKSHTKIVLDAISSVSLPRQLRAIGTGALIYLLNPVDLIPDAAPIVGYLDDFAVMSLVVGLISRGRARDRNLSLKRSFRRHSEE